MRYKHILLLVLISINAIKINIRKVMDRLNPCGVPTVTSFDMKFKYMSDPVDSIGNGRNLKNELNPRPPISGSNREAPSCTFSTSLLY